MRALVLFSGGMDSAVCAAIAARDNDHTTALTFAYDQRHTIETQYATSLAPELGIGEHIHQRIYAPLVMDGALLGHSGAIPMDRSMEQIADGLSPAFLPGRNTIFMAYAFAAAETRGIDRIYFGANIDDHNGFPDCRPGFFRAWAALMNVAKGRPGPISIKTPLLYLNKTQTVTLGRSLGVPLERTWSCYKPRKGGEPCKRCDACKVRADALGSE